jgi:hypothetical protein
VVPEGLWQTIDDRTGAPRAIVRVLVEDGVLIGYVERVLPRPDEGPDPVCLRCKGELRGQRVVGMKILWGLRPQNDRWAGGRVLDPENGREYGSRVWLETADTLKVRGYWGPFYRTQSWKRLPTATAGDRGLLPEGR